MKNEKIGIAVIGAGGMGMALVKELLAQDPRLEIRALYDPSPESVASALAKLFLTSSSLWSMPPICA